ncbi:hypothetical protein FS842_010600 [Serendipita sp. 407]|nr:hypothetical protein FS842_010600 [Serendipita sp. 407]
MWTIEWGATLRDQPSLEDEFAPIQRRELIVSASQSFAHTTISQCTIQDLNDITTLWQACQTSVFHDCVSIFKTTFSRLFPLESVNNEEFGHLIQLARWRLTPDQPNHLLWWKSTCMRRFASSPPSSTLTIRVHLYMLRELCNFIRANPGAPWMSLYLKYLAETINLSPSKLRHPATILVPRTLVDEMLLALYAALTQQSTSDVTFDDFFDGVLLNKPFSLHQELRDSAVILCASAILQYCAHLYQAVTTQQSQRLLLIIYQLLILWSGVLQGQSNGYPELMAELSQESIKMLLRGRYLSIKWLLSPHIDSFPYLCDVLMVLIDVKRTRPSLGSFCQFSISREEVSLIQPRTSYNPGAKDSVYRLQRTLELGPSPENQASQVQAIDGLMQSTTRTPELRSLLVMMLASGSLVNLEELESVHPIANRSLALLLNTYRKHIIELPHDLNERKSLMESDHWALALDFWLHRRQRFDDTPATSLLLEVISSANRSCYEKVIQCSEERDEICGAIQEAIRSKLTIAWFEGSSFGFVTLSRIRSTTWFPTFLLQLLQGSSGDHLVRWLLLFFRSEISNDLLLDMVEKDPALHLRFVEEMYMQGAGTSIANRHLILALRNTTKRRIATKKRTTIKEISGPSLWLSDLIEESRRLRQDRIYPTRNPCVASMLF